MFGFSKLTDYGLVILAEMAKNPGRRFSAGEASRNTGLPRATVRKVMGILAAAGILGSNRGTGGGYFLSRPPEEITLANLVEAMEGKPALVECATSDQPDCRIALTCAIRSGLQVINRSVIETLDRFNVAQLTETAANGPATTR
ncbi:MAG: SUF system Fe-S cluster assembly regulator [Magnetococcales bacterium]|nr:SUF system Fe-S cluster assembly regulator [Magnetococcales bacterium]